MSDVTLQARETILQEDGHLLIMGGPGSGKTTVALDKALRRISTGLLPGQSVLFLSFSRAAVSRLAEAATAQIPKALKDQLCLQTFHSFFWDVLRTHGYLLGAPKSLKILLPHDERVLSKGVKQSDKVAWAAWEKRRREVFLESGLIAFDLFAEKACELILGSLHIKELISDHFPVIIVDEAQDTGEGAWSFIAALKDVCQIICLADLEQQIFDHLPGIGPERIDAIRTTLNPMEVDLGQVSNRSPGTEIAVFAQDILGMTPRGSPYVGVGRLGYNPATGDMSKLLRMSIGILIRAVRKRGAARPDSLAILAPTGRDIALISAALTRAEKPVPHQIAFDEASSILAARFAAFLLEPKTALDMATQIAEAIELLADIEQSNGTASGLKANDQYRKWALIVREGKIPRGNLFPIIRSIIEHFLSEAFTGEPARDWLKVKAVIRGCGNSTVSGIAGLLDYLVAFNRGRRITNGLSTLWAETGSYQGARAALDAALAQDALLAGLEHPSGVHLMTVHRSKGKQFDGVVIVRRSTPIGPNQWRSSFIWRDDNMPYPRSRKILRVAITRARKHVIILDAMYPACPLLHGHVL